MDEATSSKMLDDSFGTQIQNYLNVNAIKQVLLLHEHNITNKSQDIGRSVCCLERNNYEKQLSVLSCFLNLDRQYLLHTYSGELPYRNILWLLRKNA